MSAVWEGYRLRPRTLAGATILQIVPGRREDAASRVALNIARTLLRSGARVVIAGDSGPLADAARATGAEWLPLASHTVNPVRLRYNMRTLEQFTATERVDIVHAFGATSAWSARAAAARMPVWTVTSLPDAPARRSPVAQFFDAALAGGDRVIAASAYAARPWIERHRIAADRIAIIPHVVDTALFAPSQVAPERVAGIRRSWGVGPGDRIILVPGGLPAGSGQQTLVEVARTLHNGGARNIVFICAGTDPKLQAANIQAAAQELTRRASGRGVAALFRLVGTPRDLPAALAAAHVVLVAPRDPPHLGRIVAQAQAMGRPVVASALGVLPENLLAPPRMAEALRTGWLVKPDNVASIGRALHLALALDRSDYQAMAARARQFAEFMFSPESVAAATRAVYTSLLARDD